MVSKKKKPAKRAYDNSARSAKSTQTQKEIIEALVDLLAERRGADVQIHELAEKTGITKRTIFRFFKDKQSLMKAMDEYLLSYVAAGAEQLQTFNFVEFSKNAVRLFEKNESITIAYVLSPLGQDARLLFRKKLNELMKAKIMKERKISPTKKNLKKLSFIVNLVNAKIWYDLKAEHDFTGAEVEETLSWGIETLLRELEV